MQATRVFRLRASRLAAAWGASVRMKTAWAGELFKSHLRTSGNVDHHFKPRLRGVLVVGLAREGPVIMGRYPGGGKKI